MSSNSIKISFVGDIMFQEEQLIAHKIDDKEYDFSEIFAQLDNYFEESNYSVGNLETPIAGEKLIYTNEEYVYNTPCEVLKPIKKLGINLLTTANNHCLDRKIDD